MTHPLFASYLTTAEMAEAFSPNAALAAMLRFEQALARAQAAVGIIPEEAANAISLACRAELYNADDIACAARSAGSLAIPLIKALTHQVAQTDAEAARHVHRGSTSQDVLDTAMALMSHRAWQRLDEDLSRLTACLLRLADQHAETPILARTLMQPAQVVTLGFKVAGWVAPLMRSHAALRTLVSRALALQLGGAVGTLAGMSDKGPAIAAHMAHALGLHLPEAAWHTQRDEWVRLGAEAGVLTGSLGKIAKDLALMAQAEVGELAEPSGHGRGDSSAMPHKRNPVSAMVALAAAQAAPAHVAVLLGAMGQEHERGLGNWQAELAQWPQLWLGAHGAVHALLEAFEGLHVDPSRMRRNIEALQGLIFAEPAAAVLGTAIGRAAAHTRMEALSHQAVQTGKPLIDLTLKAVRDDPALAGVDVSALQTAFSIEHSAQPAARLARQRVAALRSANPTNSPHPLPGRTAP